MYAEINKDGKNKNSCRLGVRYLFTLLSVFSQVYEDFKY